MKPFLAIVLCCSFFSSRAIPLPFEFSDCDDPDVLEAVDTALKKYNGDRTTGNQFALYMVMEGKKTAGPDTQFYVKYQIRETSCAIEENKHWKDCDYKAPAEAKTGECTARVHINKAEKTSNVSQDCKTVPATATIIPAEALCLGCYYPISSDSLQVSEILKQAIQKFNRHSDEAALFKLVEIKEAKRQVVAGWNYIIKYEIKETNCSKDQFQDLSPECKTTSTGRVGNCEAKAYANLNDQIIDTASQCKFPAEETVDPPTLICAGCPRPIPKTSPELKELLEVSMEKYNLETNDDFYYKAGDIEKATVQVVAGKSYRITFTVKKTNCSKKEFEKLNEDCEATPNSVQLKCEAQIYVIPWENKILPQVNCTEELLPVFLARRPPGFTPFRTAQYFAQSQPDTTSSNKNETESQTPSTETRKDHGHGPEGEGEPGCKHRHKHGCKHGHGFKKDHASDKRHRQGIDCGHRTGHGCGHQKHSKHGKHKHPNPKSSEESDERVFNHKETLPSSNAEMVSELVTPGAVRQETSIPAETVTLPDIFLVNGLPDRSESPLPRCPGKPWKPIMDLPVPPSFPRELTDEDLLPSAVENINPTTENSNPTQNEETSFELSDALQ
ncbi:kininogen-1 [Apteryx rowi]|uniref:kininogen-1 n=1 Tax=Apteryx rowi TaxID=308060 RepID=UPI000E1C4669|nr:kininogen-1 [Apteryx rowi]